MSPRRLASEPPLASPYLTATEAATYLRFASARQLYKAISYGVTNKAGATIPVDRRGRTLLFDKEKLRLWVDGATPLQLARAGKYPSPWDGAVPIGAQR